MKILTIALIILTIPLLRHSAAQADMRRAHTPTRAYILARIHKLTGLDTLFPLKSIEDASASAANIPFLEKELQGKAAIRVTFKRGKLKLESMAGGEEDKHSDRQFVVLLDAEANKLLAVTSTISKKDPDIHPEQSLANIEAEFGSGNHELYDAFPNADPKHTFLEALEISRRSMGNPCLAQQIDAFYVMHSEVGRESRPEWIVTLRGGSVAPPPSPPPPLPGQNNQMVDIPVWQTNHNRIFVDDMEGKWVGADTSPNPKP